MNPRLAASISHEFRTPLTLILGPLRDLEEGACGKLGMDAMQQVALARRNAERILGLVNQLDVARLDAGPRPAPPTLTTAPGVRPTKTDRAFLERVRDVMEEVLGDEELTIDDLARRLAVDRSNLYRRLHSLTGRSPSALLVERRLARAAELLTAGADSVGEVAYAVGFKTVSHFSRRFHARYGVSPSAFPPS